MSNSDNSFLSNTIYQNKYLKYKSKYNMLSKQLGGSDPSWSWASGKPLQESIVDHSIIGRTRGENTRLTTDVPHMSEARIVAEEARIAAKEARKQARIAATLARQANQRAIEATQIAREAVRDLNHMLLPPLNLGRSLSEIERNL
jgi:hypothetical protein